MKLEECPLTEHSPVISSNAANSCFSDIIPRIAAQSYHLSLLLSVIISVIDFWGTDLSSRVMCRLLSDVTSVNGTSTVLRTEVKYMKLSNICIEANSDVYQDFGNASAAPQSVAVETEKKRNRQ